MSDYPFVRAHRSGVLLDITVVPKSSRNQICGTHDQRLKLQITAPPSDGAANRAICQFIAKLLGVAKSSVTIVTGETSRRKTVLIDGANLDAVRAQVDSALGQSG